MKQLLGEEGYEQYKQQQKENNQKSSNSDEEEEEEDKQIKVDGQQFILP